VGSPEREDKSSLPGLTRQSIHLRQTFLAKKMDARGVSAFTRVFDALLPAHDWLDEALTLPAYAA
jgi:hypothetical protein